MSILPTVNGSILPTLKEILGKFNIDDTDCSKAAGF